VKSLYDKNLRYTPEAFKIDEEAYPTVKAIFDRWIEQGYSPREISHILQACVVDYELYSVLDFRDDPIESP